MKISTKGIYALEMVVDLAIYADDGNRASIRSVAVRRKLSEKYPEAAPPHLRDNRRSAPPTYTTDDCSGQEIRKSIPSLHPVCV